MIVWKAFKARSLKKKGKMNAWKEKIGRGKWWARWWPSGQVLRPSKSCHRNHFLFLFLFKITFLLEKRLSAVKRRRKNKLIDHKGIKPRSTSCSFIFFFYVTADNILFSLIKMEKGKKEKTICGHLEEKENE